MNYPKQIAMVGFALSALAVALGAFGAHYLKATLVLNNRMDTYELAVRYHFYHALALLALASIFHLANKRAIIWSARLITIGVTLFSGSLYVLAILNYKAVAIVTPIGGVAMMAGWLTGLWALHKGKNVGENKTLSKPN
jgi:uncharacterized membrane protein YgdD (TMEM256/DUF423 family)